MENNDTKIVMSILKLLSLLYILISSVLKCHFTSVLYDFEFSFRVLIASSFKRNAYIV